jgi:hypothetical protein
MKIVEVFEGNLFQAQMIKNLMEIDDIESFLKDELVGTRNPVWRPGSGVRVMVSDLDYDRARLIVDEFEKNLKSK